jgi:hypothetical protein
MARNTMGVPYTEARITTPSGNKRGGRESNSPTAAKGTPNIRRKYPRAAPPRAMKNAANFLPDLIMSNALSL